MVLACHIISCCYGGAEEAAVSGESDPSLDERGGPLDVLQDVPGQLQALELRTGADAARIGSLPPDVLRLLHDENATPLTEASSYEALRARAGFCDRIRVSGDPTRCGSNASDATPSGSFGTPPPPPRKIMPRSSLNDARAHASPLRRAELEHLGAFEKERIAAMRRATIC